MGIILCFQRMGHHYPPSRGRNRQSPWNYFCYDQLRRWVHFPEDSATTLTKSKLPCPLWSLPYCPGRASDVITH